MPTPLEKTLKADNTELGQERDSLVLELDVLQGELKIIKEELVSVQKSHQNDRNIYYEIVAASLEELASLNLNGHDDIASEVGRTLLLMFAARIRRGAYNE